MKLYIQACRHCGNKINLSVKVQDRIHFRNIYGEPFNLRCHTCGETHSYYTNEVMAESDSNAIIGGPLVGGLVGILGGPIGIILGLASGLAIGGVKSSEDLNSIRRFNNS